MTREELKSITADFFKESEEAIPIVGDGDKKEWMARRIDEILENDEPVLNCLLGLNTISEVREFMDEQYKDRNDEEGGNDLSCAVPPKEENQTTHAKGYHTVGTNEDRVAAGTGNVQDPMLVVEEVIIIEDVTPETPCMSDGYPKL